MRFLLQHDAGTFERIGPVTHSEVYSIQEVIDALRINPVRTSVYFNDTRACAVVPDFHYYQCRKRVYTQQALEMPVGTVLYSLNGVRIRAVMTEDEFTRLLREAEAKELGVA